MTRYYYISLLYHVCNIVSRCLYSPLGNYNCLKNQEHTMEQTYRQFIIFLKVYSYFIWYKHTAFSGEWILVRLEDVGTRNRTSFSPAIWCFSLDWKFMMELNSAWSLMLNHAAKLSNTATMSRDNKKQFVTEHCWSAWYHGCMNLGVIMTPIMKIYLYLKLITCPLIYISHSIFNLQ